MKFQNKFECHDKIYYFQFENPIAGIVVQKGFDNHNNIWKYQVLLEDVILLTRDNEIRRTNTFWAMENELICGEIR